MAATCGSCGRGLSFVQRARGRRICDECTEKAEAASAKATSQYPLALQAVIDSGAGAAPLVDQLRALEKTITAGGGDVSATKTERYQAYLHEALADETLTAGEESVLEAVGAALYPEDERPTLLSLLARYRSQLFVAMVNDGRLPDLSDGHIVLKRGEVLHLEEPAALLKEVIQREWRSGSQGMSFRVMKGVSYRLGSTRGHMVEVGRTLEAADEGTLCVTSLRVVYTGLRKSMEMPYTKFLDLNVYTDAIQIHVTNRQNPPTFRVGDGPMVAAAINAAMQRTL